MEIILTTGSGNEPELDKKGLSGNMFSSFKGGQTGRLMVFSGQNWYQRMHFLYAEALVKATCLIIPIFID